MVRNEQKYQQALQFRKRGFTLAEIAKICDVSKSTVSKWLRNKAFSDAVTQQNKRRAGQENAKRLRLVNKARSNERAKRYSEVERSAVTEYKHYKLDPLFIAGVLLYQSHGDMYDNHLLRLSTTAQVAHTVFISFALEYLGAEKKDIRFWLLLYPGHTEETCLKSWKKSTGLSYGQFHKSQQLKTKTRTKPLHSGVGNTIIGSTVLKRKLTVWIGLLQKDLTKQ